MKVEVEALRAKVDFSVHLIGRTYGSIPDEETRSYGEAQYDLACAERGRPGFHQLVWIPEDLENPGERQQAFLKKVRENVDVNASGNGDVFETSFESFKEGLLDVVSRKPEPPPIPKAVKTKAVYLVCDQPDLRQEQLEKIKYIPAQPRTSG